MHGQNGPYFTMNSSSPIKCPFVVRLFVTAQSTKAFCALHYYVLSTHQNLISAYSAAYSYLLMFTKWFLRRRTLHKRNDCTVVNNRLLMNLEKTCGIFHSLKSFTNFRMSSGEHADVKTKWISRCRTITWPETLILLLSTDEFVHTFADLLIDICCSCLQAIVR